MDEMICGAHLSAAVLSLDDEQSEALFVAAGSICSVLMEIMEPVP